MISNFDLIYYII